MADGPKYRWCVAGPIDPRSGAPTWHPALGEPPHVTEMRKRVEALESALAPFAKLTRHWVDRLPDEARIGGAMVLTDRQGGLTFEHDYTMGDLRRAHALLFPASERADLRPEVDGGTSSEGSE